MEEKIRWKKVGGGTFRLGSGKIIKPNQVFVAFPSQIPEAHRDLVVPLDSITDPSPVIAPVDNFEVVEKGGGWFDVVNKSTGKPVNDRGLRESEAKELLESVL